MKKWLGMSPRRFQRLTSLYCVGSVIVVVVTALLHRKIPQIPQIPQTLYDVHYVILAGFVAYAAIRLWREQRLLKKERREFRQTVLSEIHHLLETGVLDYEREHPSKEELLSAMFLATALHALEPDSKLEIAMLDGWLAHWGFTWKSTHVTKVQDRKS